MLEAEILVLRQQIVVLRRGKAGRLPFSAIDRMVLGRVIDAAFASFARQRAGALVVGAGAFLISQRDRIIALLSAMRFRRFMDFVNILPTVD